MIHSFLSSSFLLCLRIVLEKYLISNLLPHQVKEQKTHTLLTVCLAADSPGVLLKPLKFWKTFFRPTALCLVLSTQFLTENK